MENDYEEELEVAKMLFFYYDVCGNTTIYCSDSMLCSDYLYVD